MNHKLRPRHTPSFVPVAAEVLELRTLLSAGGSAAHAATRHAVEAHTARPHVVQSAPFHNTLNAEFRIGSDTPFFIPVNFLISSIKAVEGAKVTAHASAAFPMNGGMVTIKATFKGTVQSFTPDGNSTDFVIAPTGGSIVIKFSKGGQHSTATALPNGTLSGARIFGTTFTDFHATDLFTSDSVSPFTNETILFDLNTT